MEQVAEVPVVSTLRGGGGARGGVEGGLILLEPLGKQMKRGCISTYSRQEVGPGDPRVYGSISHVWTQASTSVF